MKQYTYPQSAFTIRSAARAARVRLSSFRSRKRAHNLTLCIIGFPKCGTTSLHKTLLQTNTFSGVPHETQAHDYLSCDSYCNINFIKNPNLIYEPWWLLALDKTAGPAKFIICVRDPVIALHSFYWYRHNEVLDPASWIPSRQRNNIASEASVMNGEATLIGASRDRINFPIWIEHLLHMKGSKDVHCIVLEELESNPCGVQSRLSDFLDTPIKLSAISAIANKNIRKPMAQKMNLEQLYGSDDFFNLVRIRTNEPLYNHWGIRNQYW